MNIVVIAERWGESTGIGSLRPMKITKYLLRMGHCVTVICGSYVKDVSNPGNDLIYLRSQPNYSERSIFGNSGIFRLIQNRGENILNKKGLSNALINDSDGSGGIPFLRKFLRFIYVRCYTPMKRKNSVRCALRAIKKEGLTKPGLIFSSYEPIQVHLLAWKLKHMFPDARWHADFRDPIPHFADLKAIYYCKDNQQKSICRKADIVTFVSKGLKDQFAYYGLSNMHTLYSGFDLEDEQGKETMRSPKGKMVFSYTGSLYPGLSNLFPFFTALKDLVTEGKIEPQSILIIYAGMHPEEFLRQTRILENKVEIRVMDFISRNDAIAIQRSSDLLLFASLNNKRSLGMVSGKLYEYWLSAVPIIAIIDGDLPYSEPAKMIKQSNTGFVYENALKNKDYSELKDYILGQYQHKMLEGKTEYSPNKQYIEQFEYSKIVSKILELSFGSINETQAI